MNEEADEGVSEEVVSTTQLSSEARADALASAVAQYVKGGWRVETQTDYSATLVKGHRPNHVLHLILTIITLGIWLIVWILVSILSGEKRAALRVDAEGNVQRTKG